MPTFAELRAVMAAEREREHISIIDMAGQIAAVTGSNPLTPRWEATLRAFYGLELRQVDVDNLEHATGRTADFIRGLNRRQRRELWARVGRRGRKSYIAALIALYEAVYGGHEKYIQPGELGLVAVISKDQAGSVKVAEFVELHAKAIGFDPSWSSIGSVRVLRIPGIPFGIACFPCNAKAPRGFASPVVIADEIAHWATDEVYVNADTVVLAAIKPMMAQFPNAKLISISSPLGREGTHYTMMEVNLRDRYDPANDNGLPEDAGTYRDEDMVLAVEGPTWEWNPEITEARTRELERDPGMHAREFGAVPAAFIQSNWFGEALDQAVSLPLAVDAQGLKYIIAIDAADINDRFGWAVLSSQPGEVVTEAGRFPRMTNTHDAGAWKPEGKPSEMLRRLRADVCEKYYPNKRPDELITVYADQYGGHALVELARQQGINLIVVPWTGGSGETSKLTRFRRLRAAMLEGCFQLPNTVSLVKGFRAVREVISSSGNSRIETPRTASGHGDDVSAVVLGASVALESTARRPDDMTQKTEQQIMRAAAIRESNERKRRESQTAFGQHDVMRRAFGR